MHFRISSVLCWALLVALTSAAQNNQRNNNGFSFKDADAEIEGSGNDGEIKGDLDESSGSGQGPTDDEDVLDRDINIPNNPEPNIPNKIVPVVYGVDTSGNNNKEPINVTPTEDSGVIMNPKPEDRPTSFFSQPGILAAVIGGAVVGLLCAILVVMFIVYRMRKKDEGSYTVGEPKQSPNSTSYSRGTNKEFYA
ncbi:syndecan [Sitophilus oryzae]|uniref:Syndecan n=1 Tax=Sitophilus oryzae TaxID=7048 RepID=A0A6J2XBX6_SITOR|nr:syndecan [Sitophilus oryzae]